MTSLSIRTDQLSFPQTCEYLTTIARTRVVTAIQERFVRELVQSHVPEGVVTSYKFYDTIECLELPAKHADDGKTCIIVLSHFPSLITFYPEVDFWLISMMFDQFPFHTVDLEAGLVLVYPCSIEARITSTGPLCILVADLA